MEDLIFLLNKFTSNYVIYTGCILSYMFTPLYIILYNKILKLMLIPIHQKRIKRRTLYIETTKF